MRFAGLHKLASYLMALSAFGALALSGELGTVTVLLWLCAVALSWFWPKGRDLGIWSTLAALAAFAWTGLSVLRSGSFLIEITRFLLLLVVLKLLGRRTARDDQTIQLLSFLMLVSGTTLNPGLSYAICFLGFVVSATWALALSHLHREMESVAPIPNDRVRLLDDRRLVGPAFLAGTSAVSLVIFAVSALLFLLIPRIGFGLFVQKSRSNLALAGFRDGVKLGGHGLIRNDSTVVMRVVVDDPAQQGQGAPALHFRGAAFDHYDHGKWSRTRQAFSGGYRLGIQTGGGARVTLSLSDLVHAPHRKRVRQEIYLEPIDSSILFAASMPVSIEVATPPYGHRGAGVGLSDEVRYEHGAGIRYIATSDVEDPPPTVLAAAPPPDIQRMAPYLQLPADLPARIVGLAQELTASAITPYEKLLAIEKYLARNYTYTLDMDTDDTAEPLDYFLFERKRGHCEYFSSALAILLRAVGVPTRNVNGFLGGEWNEYGGYIAVRNGDAHSWVEVWLEGVGWVTRDPTPPGSDPLGRGGGGAIERLRRLLDTVRLQWFKWVIEYDLSKQIDVIRGSTGWLGRSPGDFLRRLRGLWQRSRNFGPAFVVVLVSTIGLLLLRRRRDQASRTRKKAHRHPIITLYNRALRLLSRRGHERPPSRTPREHARVLAHQGLTCAPPFATLTELYYVARFDPGSIKSGDLTRASALLDQIRKSPTARPSSAPGGSRT